MKATHVCLAAGKGDQQSTRKIRRRGDDAFSSAIRSQAPPSSLDRRAHTHPPTPSDEIEQQASRHAATGWLHHLFLSCLGVLQRLGCDSWTQSHKANIRRARLALDRHFPHHSTSHNRRCSEKPGGINHQVTRRGKNGGPRNAAAGGFGGAPPGGCSRGGCRVPWAAARLRTSPRVTLLLPQDEGWIDHSCWLLRKFVPTGGPRTRNKNQNDRCWASSSCPCPPRRRRSAPPCGGPPRPFPPSLTAPPPPPPPCCLLRLLQGPVALVAPWSSSQRVRRSVVSLALLATLPQLTLPHFHTIITAAAPAAPAAGGGEEEAPGLGGRLKRWWKKTAKVDRKKLAELGQCVFSLVSTSYMYV